MTFARALAAWWFLVVWIGCGSVDVAENVDGGNGVPDGGGAVDAISADGAAGTTGGAGGAAGSLGSAGAGGANAGAAGTSSGGASGAAGAGAGPPACTRTPVVVSVCSRGGRLGGFACWNCYATPIMVSGTVDVAEAGSCVLPLDGGAVLCVKTSVSGGIGCNACDPPG